MNKISRFIPGVFIVIFTFFIFRQYFLGNKVPIPGNLLLSFYQPWASYTWDGYINGLPSKPIGFDTLRMFYPLRKIVTDQIKLGEFPLWNPYSFSGNVIFAAYQSAVFHPLTWLFLVLPQMDAWTVVILLIPILTYFAMSIFLRDLELSNKAVFFGSITYAFSGIMIVWWEEMFMSVYSIIPLPLVLYAINGLYKKINSKDILILVISLLFSIFSGYFQTTFYLFVLSGLFTVYKFFHSKEKKITILLTIVSGFIISLLIAGIQLVPSYEAYRLSARSVTDVKLMFVNFFASLSHLVTFLAPDYFGNPATHNYSSNSFYHEKVIWIGIPALQMVLLSVSLFFTKNNNVYSKFFTVMGLIFLSLIFSLPTSWFVLYSLHLPFISEMTPTRISYLSTFCFCVLSSFGMDHFLKKKEIVRHSVIFIILLSAFFFLWKYAILKYTGVEYNSKVYIRNLLLPSGIFIISSFIILFSQIKVYFRKYAYYLLIIISLLNTVYFANKYLYFNNRKYIYPDTAVIKTLKRIIGINRYWSVGDAYINRNFSNYFSLQSPEGYESFNIKRYSDLLYFFYNRLSNDKKQERADAFLYPIKDLSELKEDDSRLKLMNLLGVKYVVTLQQNEKKLKENINIFKKIWTDNTFNIYENTQSLPRFFLANRYITVKNDNEILRKLYDPRFDMRGTVILESIPSGFSSNVEATGTAQLSTYTPNYLKFTTYTNNPMLFFLSDNYYPGWNAFIDGNSTTVYRANYSFRSVIIPKGKHFLEFKYQPESLKIGLYITASGILMLIGLIIYTSGNRKQRLLN